jgi:class 3 adenylate cyclase
VQPGYARRTQRLEDHRTRVQLTSIDVIASALPPVLSDLDQLSSPDGAVTLMLSDIAEADAVSARLGQERWDELLRDHHALAGQLVARHDGRVVKVERDGFMTSFNSAHGGLHCAIELQRTFAGSADGSVKLRVGLHSGFVIAANPEQLLGRNVVLAARIAAHAAPSEILVSSSLKEYAEGDPRFQFERRGEYHFKGVLGEHVVYAVEWRGEDGV